MSRSASNAERLSTKKIQLAIHTNDIKDVNKKAGSVEKLVIKIIFNLIKF